MHEQARSSSDPQQNPCSPGEAAVTLAGSRQGEQQHRSGGQGETLPQSTQLLGASWANRSS